MPYNQEYFDSYHKIPTYRLKYPDENVIRFLVSNFSTKERYKKTILDLGCGTGRHLILLAELGFQPYGIDGSPVALKYAKNWLKRQKLFAEITKGLITHLPYSDNFFDGVIEHATLVNNEWEDIIKACQECHRVLKKGGVGFFLLKTKKDCAFDKAKKVGYNTYLIDEVNYISSKELKQNLSIIFHAFSKKDIHTMFKKFQTIRIHTWEMSFKSLNIDEMPGNRLTSYWIVLVQK